MGDDSNKDLLLWLGVFWTLLLILSNVFQVDLSNARIDNLVPSDQQKATFLDKLFNAIDQIPVVNLINPLLKIMSFQYTDQVPGWISAFLVMISFFSAIAVVGFIRNG